MLDRLADLGTFCKRDDIFKFCFVRNPYDRLLFKSKLPQLHKYLDMSLNLQDGAMQREGAQKYYFKLQADSRQAVKNLSILLDEAEKQKKFDIWVYYSSIYEEHWYVHMLSKNSIPVPY